MEGKLETQNNFLIQGSGKMSEKATFELLPGRGEGASQVKL